MHKVAIQLYLSITITVKMQRKLSFPHLNDYKRDDVMFFRANDGDTDNECDYEDPISSKGQDLLTISQNFFICH
jgi:hypothetical protein